MEGSLRELGAPEEYSIGELDTVGVSEVSGIHGAPGEPGVPGNVERSGNAGMLGVSDSTDEHNSWQFPFNNLLESLTLEDLITTDPEGIDAWSFEDGLSDAEYELLDNLITLEEARKVMAEAEKIYAMLQKRMKAGQWDEDVLLVKRWRETAKKAAQLFVLARGGSSIPYPFTDEIEYLYDFGCKKGGFVNGNWDAAKWKIKVRVLDEYYDNSIYYSRNYTPSDANGVRFQNDLEHEAEMADRLLAMCHWKEKLEVTDSKDRWIRPADENAMMIPLRPEQELLPGERERIERDRKQIEEWRIKSGREKEKEEVVDDRLYQALSIAMLEHKSVCIEKEGTEPGEGYPDTKIRNTSIEKLV